MKSPWLVLALLVALSGGCSKGREAMETEEATAGVAGPAADTVAQARSAAEPAANTAPPPAVRSRKLIRRLDVHLVVKDTEAAAQRLPPSGSSSSRRLWAASCRI